MEVVSWKFPSFENWCNNNHKWNGSIGEYNCSIDIFSWMENSAKYMCAVSTESIPSNIYAHRIILQSKEIKYDDVEELQNWYNKTVEYVNDKWKKYIFNTYTNLKL